VFFLFAGRALFGADVAVTMLLVGRALLGVADSFIITGALSWGLTLLGARSTGKVMAWVGTALYAAFAVGAPIGSALYSGYGFFAIGVATILIPLCGLALLAPMRIAATPSRMQPTALRSVAGAVWQPGIALALSGVGFGAIMAFIALLFVDHHWTPVWPAFSALSVAFIVGRLCCGGLPDKVGGAKVAVVCILIETVGLLLVGEAPSMPIVLAGIALAGLGYSLVFPGLGAEAIRRAPAQSRGVTMGVYTAFLDLSLGVSSPLLGFVAGSAGMNAVYLVSAAIVLTSAVAALGLWRRARSEERANQ
jgi:predicted MFS family arabinose efflux permease